MMLLYSHLAKHKNYAHPLVMNALIHYKRAGLVAISYTRKKSSVLLTPDYS